MLAVCARVHAHPRARALACACMHVYARTHARGVRRTDPVLLRAQWPPTPTGNHGVAEGARMTSQRRGTDDIDAEGARMTSTPKGHG